MNSPLSIKDCTCDPRDPLIPCEYHARKAKTLLLEMSDARDYEPMADLGDNLQPNKWTPDERIP